MMSWLPFAVALVSALSALPGQADEKLNVAAVSGQVPYKHFDAMFYGVNAKLARNMDPVSKLAYQRALEAIVDAAPATATFVVIGGISSIAPHGPSAAGEDEPPQEAAGTQLKVGSRVVRGPDWMWGDQDGGGEGRVTGTHIDLGQEAVGWVLVRWPGGDSSKAYRMGAGGKYDLRVVDDAVAPSSSSDGGVLPSRIKVGSLVARGPDWEWGDQDGNPPGRGRVTKLEGSTGISGWVRVKWASSDEENSYRMGYSDMYDLVVVDEDADDAAPTTGSTAAVKVGARVVRGPDWKWGSQDGAPPGEGRVVAVTNDGWVDVRWASGHEYSYRMGHEDKYDLRVLDDTTAKSGSAAATIKVGARVVRGPDWKWGSQDGTPPGPGFVTAVEDELPGWVRVRWVAGGFNTYRMGAKGSYDLTVVGEPDSSDVVGVTGPEGAALLRIGSRVVRGPDWKWADQDGDPLNEGRVVSLRKIFGLSGWVSVLWPHGRAYTYRMGFNGKYDLRVLYGGIPAAPTVVVVEAAEPDAESKPSVVAAQSPSSSPVSPAPIAPPRPSSSPNVTNDTASGRASPPRPSAVSPPSITPTTTQGPPSTSNRGNSVPDGEDDFHGLRVGSVVVRGPDWDWGDQDGPAPRRGRVIMLGTPDGEVGWVTVRWANGDENSYRMGTDGKYDLKAAVSDDVGVDPEASREAEGTSRPGPVTGSTTTTATPPGLSDESDWEWVVTRPRSPSTRTSATTATTPSDSFDSAEGGGGSSGGSNSTASGPGRAQKLDRVKPCSRVVRGPDWTWGSQDGTPPGEGRVRIVGNHGWVSVEWPSGQENIYRMGADGKHDLRVLDEDDAASPMPSQRCDTGGRNADT